MGEIDRRNAAEKVLRKVAIVVAVGMLLTFLSIVFTGLLTLYTAISAAFLMVATATLFVMDMAV